MRAASEVVTLPVGVVTTVLTTLGVILAAALTALVARRSHRDDNLRTDVARLSTDVAAARAEAADVRRENRILADYVHQLRTLLDDAGEDVPPWPDGLTT